MSIVCWGMKCHFVGFRMMFRSVTHSSSKCALSFYHVPGTVLRAGCIVINIDMLSALRELLVR